MEAEISELIGAQRGERSEDRATHRNGSCCTTDTSACSEHFLGCYRRARIAAGGQPPFRRTGDERAEIKRMRVAPHLQRLGFGRRVLEHLETRAAELGYTHLHLDTTAWQFVAQALYRSHGYRETAREQRDRFELVFYEKNLVRNDSDR